MFEMWFIALFSTLFYANLILKEYLVGIASYDEARRADRLKLYLIIIMALSWAIVVCF